MSKTEKDYTLKVEKKTEVDKKIESTGIPVYMERYEFKSDEDKDRCLDEILKELDAIQAERDSINLEDKIDARENQYQGIMVEDSRLQFNLNRNITKPIVDRVANYIKQGYFKSDPVYSISPRPEYDKEGGRGVTERQQDFLDYKLDNLPFRSPESKTILCAVKQGTGILKISHFINQKKKRREERYIGQLEPVLDPTTHQPIIINGQALMENKGLKEFLSNWPEAERDYPGLVQQLKDQKEISIIAEYQDIIYNDPRPQFIELKNFYVRLSCEGYDGLSEQKLIAERKNYSWWELQQEAKKNNFYDIDQLVQDDKDKTKNRQGYEEEVFEIFEFTYYFQEDKDSDKDPIRLVVWASKEKKVIIGSVLYPHDFECYVPHYISAVNSGFYQPGLAEFTTDSHIAQSVLLNLLLGGVYIRNTITPVTKDSEVINQFLEKRFSHGIPIEAKPGDIDFLQKYMSQIDVGGIMNTMQFMKQGDEEVVGSSSLMSGNETPFDPQAPASKTMALLKMAGISVDEYISCMTPAFNQIAYVFLQLYYQMSTEGRKYRIKPERVVGDNPFGEISRADMIARTNIQAQAYAYDFDKLQSKKEDFALWQILRADPVFNSNPESVYNLARILVKNWSQKWNNNVDKLLPNPQEVQKKQLQIAIQAVSMYIQMVIKNSQETGVALEFDPRQLIAMVIQMQKESVTPPTKEELQARQENNA